MTVSVTTVFDGPFAGNGVGTVFPFTFKAETSAEIRVLVGGIEVSNYSATVSDSGGSVTFTSPPANGAKILIASNPSFTQETSFEDAGPFLPSTHDLVSDRAAIRDLYLRDVTARSIRAPLGEVLADLPDKATRAGKFPAFDANGDPTVTGSMSGADTALRSDLAATTALGLIGTPYGAPLSGVVREQLSADRTYYVRTNGSDANTGLANTAGAAFLTIQKAINTVRDRLDLHGFKAIIQVADGTYSAPVSFMGKLVGARDSAARPLQIIGNETTPANVVVNPSTSYAIEAWDHAYALIAGITIQNATGIGMMANNYAMIEHRNCVFGACPNAEKIMTFYNAVIKAIGPVTVTGNGVSFVHATKRSVVDFAGQTVTFAGAPAFSQYLYGVNDSSVNFDSATILGTATGGITVHINGALNVSSVTGIWTGGAAPLVTSGGLILIEDRFASRSFYVRPGGSDTNDGLQNTDAHAFHTIQGAVDAISKLQYDPIAWTNTLAASIVIQVANGTYAETVNLRDLEYLSGTIVGDEVTPGNVIVNGVTDGFAASNIHTPWFIRGLKVTATAGDGIRASQGAQVNYRNVEFGAASKAHCVATRGGRLIADGDYKITGAAANHFRAKINAVIDITGITITLTGTPAFSASFASVSMNSTLRAAADPDLAPATLAVVFSGSATGTRYSAVTNGVIDTGGGGASFIPGSSVGSTATGGQYV